jgi:hypothetical protein
MWIAQDVYGWRVKKSVRVILPLNPVLVRTGMDRGALLVVTVARRTTQRYPHMRMITIRRAAAAADIRLTHGPTFPSDGIGTIARTIPSSDE